MSSPSCDFSLFSSFRYDVRLLSVSENNSLGNDAPTPIYMLRYHRDRMLQAAEYLGWSQAVDTLRDLCCLEGRITAGIREKIGEAVEKRDDVALKVGRPLGLWRLPVSSSYVTYAAERDVRYGLWYPATVR